MPDTFEDHHSRGIEFFKNNQIDKAISEFQKSIHLRADYSDSHYHLGVSYKQVGQLKESIQELQKCLKINQKDIECRKILALLYYDQGQYRKAIDESKKIFDIDKTDFEFFSHFGSKLSESDDEKILNIAKAYLESASKINPDDINTRKALLELCIFKGEGSVDAEKTLLKDLYDLDPSNIKVIMRMAVRHGFFHDPRIEKRCIAELKENLEKNPNKNQACADFAFAMLAAADTWNPPKQDLLKEAIQTIPQIIEKQPKSDNENLVQAYIDLGFSFARLGLINEETACYDKALQIISSYKSFENAFGACCISEFYERHKQYGKIVRAYKKALTFSDNSHRERDNMGLGEAYFKLHKYCYAKDEFEKIPKYLKQEYGLAQHYLEKIEAKLKEIEKAEKEIDGFERKIRLVIEVQLLKHNKSFETEIREYALFQKIDELINQDKGTFPYRSHDDINPFDYCTIMQYFDIIEHFWDIFKPIFLQKGDVKKKLTYINRFRNAVKHNRSIEDETIKYCEGSVVWMLKMMDKNDHTI